MSSDEDSLVDVTVDAVMEQRCLAAAAPVSPFDNVTRGGTMSDNLLAILGGAGANLPPVSSPSVSFGTDLLGINQLGEVAMVQPSPAGESS